jgi:NAD(P)-dependent dehydrogenase (short-subunit alcohol dehydrogenase family)
VKAPLSCSGNRTVRTAAVSKGDEIMRLAGKRTIITGAAAGIGTAIAERFCAEGARVLIADRDFAGAEATAARLRGTGAEAVAARVDVSVSASVAAMVASCVDVFGGLDVLVNNAGIVHPQDTDAVSTPEDAWDTTLAVNLKSVYLGAKHAIPVIEAGGGGAIVNIASIVAMLGSHPSQIAYTASKGGIVALSRELAVSLARRGIRVNAVCPGVTATAMSAQLVRDDAAYELRRLHIPMGRLGLPAEVAALTAFLASDDASYITGQAIPVDGGMVGAYLTPADPV